MLIITDADELALALASPLPENIKALLALRRDQLLSDTNGEYELGELAHWVIVAQGDALPAIEAAANYPIAPDPPWEWVLDHDGIFEAPIILSDDGFGVVLIVPDEPGIDPILIAMLRRDAQRAENIKS
jgi:hypothetical protein